MGVIDEMFFGAKPKPRITKEEFKKVRENLYYKYKFSKKELDEVEEIFRADMNEEKDLDKGIDAAEVVRGIQYMRDHMQVHKIPIDKVNNLEIELMKFVSQSL